MTSIEFNFQQLSHVIRDTSTVINETHNDTSQKIDESLIQINMNSRQELNENVHERKNISLKTSNDQEKFKSLVIAMTALKDDQKV